MRKSLVIAALCLAVSGPAFAVDFGLRVGRYNDVEEEFVGVELAIPFATNFTFNPALEYVLIDDDEFDEDLWVLVGDVNYNFSPGGTVNPYLGAGIGALIADGETEGIYQVNAGLEFRIFRTARPYVQGRYFRLMEDADADDIAVIVGLRF